MYQILSTSEAVKLLKNDRNTNWSWGGAWALVKYLENLEHSTDTKIEFDLVAFCVEYSEYDSILQAAKNYDVPFLEDGENQEEKEAIALEWFQDRTTVIQFDGGIILQNF